MDYYRLQKLIGIEILNENQSILCILGRPYNIPGAEADANNPLKTSEGMSMQFLISRKKLFNLSSIFLVYLSGVSEMVSNLVLSAISSVILLRYIALSNRTTPLPLSGLHTIISLLADNDFNDLCPYE